MSSRVTYGSYIAKSGRYRITGSSHWSFPCSTSSAIAVAVNSFVFDAMPNRVSAPTRSGRPSCRTP